MMKDAYEPPRRPIAMRSQEWVKSLARAVTAAGISPNAISLSGLGFAIVAGVALAATGYVDGALRVTLFIAAAVCIQLRLLCNMLDGMVAIEGGRRTPYGEIFNDMPDRFADVAILVGAGFSLTAFPWGPTIGWIAGLLAVLTAYVRLLGASMGTPQYFMGPMAKPHRMGTITAACVLSIFEPFVGLRGDVVAVALAIVILGSIVTFVRRTRCIVENVSAR